MRVYVGMDVHRKRSQVALVDEHGGQLLNRNLPNGSAELTSILGRLEPGTPVAFEAAYGWGWLAELLEELSLEPHLVHPSRCKAIASARLNDDRVDARTLAQLLRAELLPEAWIAPQAVRDQRALLRYRAALVRMATALKCRVHAILADRGVSVDEPLWSRAGRLVLAELALPAVQRAIVADCLALIDAISPLVARLERDLLTRTRPDPRVQALQALPGIGPITAMTLVAEIGDIGRFPTARKLCAWAGLTPAVRNSDRKVRRGHITKMGSPWVRFVLQEAAQRAKTRPPFASFYAKTAVRRGKHIATVAGHLPAGARGAVVEVGRPSGRGAPAPRPMRWTPTAPPGKRWPKTTCWRLAVVGIGRRYGCGWPPATAPASLRSAPPISSRRCSWGRLRSYAPSFAGWRPSSRSAAAPASGSGRPGRWSTA